MSMWISGATLLVGAGTSIYGADKQRKLNNQAKDANKAENQSVRDENLRRYLMTRGVGANGMPINSKLPLWANVTRGPNGFRVAAPNALAPRYALPAPAGATAGGGGRSWAALGVT